MNGRLIILFLLFTTFGPNVSAQEFFFTKYTISDGLVNNAVRKIYQDSKGFLWICTWEGLSKYDGHKFTNFSTANGLSHSMVNDIIEVTPGEFYIANNNGTVDVIKNDKVRLKSVVKDIVFNQFYINRQGKILTIADIKGIYELRNNKFYCQLQSASKSFFDLVELDSVLLLGGHPEPVTVYTKNYKLVSQLASSTMIVWALHQDQHKRIWVCTSEGIKLLKTDDGFKNLSLHLPAHPFNIPALTQTETRCIFEEQDGTIWFGTVNGLLKVSPDGDVQKLTVKDGLPSDQINSIFQDSEDNLWIGTSSGLAKAVRKFQVKINQLTKLNTSTVLYYAYPVNDSLFFLTTSNGIYKYTTRDMKFSLWLPQSNYEAIPAIVPDSDPLLLIGQRKSFTYNVREKKWISSPMPLSNEDIGCAVRDKYDQFFLGTMHGLLLYRNNTITKIKEFPTRVNNLVIDKSGYLWIGTWYSGLYKVKFDDQGKIIENRNLTWALGDSSIRTLFEDKNGNVWAGTRYHGVVRFPAADLSGDTLHYNDQHGLLSNWIWDIDEDEDDNIWLTTHSGLNKLIKHSTGYRVFNFSRVTNFFGQVVSIIKIRQNKVWCSYNQGFVELSDNKFERLPPTRVYITNAVLGNSTDNLAYEEQTEQHPIQLSHKKNQAYFEFTSPVFLNEKEMLYSYRLLGSRDTAWHIPANIHSVQYASLQPGSYQFEVRMLGWNGNFGPITDFSFTVNPPYWKRGWFYLLIAVITLAILYSMYKYRIRQLVKMQQVRNKIATDLHDDIGSTLTNIGILSELSKKNLQQPQLAEKFLMRITEESVASQQALDDIIWSVNTNNDSLASTFARMRRYAAEVFENSSTHCSLEFDNVEPGMKISMDQRRDLYLIFKEGLNNIQKHAEAKTVIIKAGIQHQYLHLSIQDDGKGFYVGRFTERNGLANMQNRAEKWSGTLTINSAPGKGTTIYCKLPLT